MPCRVDRRPINLYGMRSAASRSRDQPEQCVRGLLCRLFVALIFEGHSDLGPVGWSWPDIHSDAVDVRFWPKADYGDVNTDVRSWPKADVATPKRRRSLLTQMYGPAADRK